MPLFFIVFMVPTLAATTVSGASDGATCGLI